MLPFDEPEPDPPAPARATVDGRDALPELATRPLGRRLGVAPKSSPRGDETVMVKARRGLIAEPERWIELSTRHTLSEAAARRLVASFVRAKPARLDPDATGTFAARAYQRNGRWHVAATYLPPPAGDPALRQQRGGRGAAPTLTEPADRSPSRPRAR